MSQTIGEAVIHVTLDDRNVSTDAAKSGTQSGTSFTDGFKSSLKLAAAAAAGFAAVKTVAFLKQSVAGASDLNETVSKTNVIFGDAAKKVVNFADRGAAAFGQTKQQILDAAGTFGTFGKAAGLQGKGLAGFSNQLVGLSSDLSSFFNTDPTDAATAIAAALRGESEPIRAYGVLLDDASLKAEALSQGLLKPVKDQAKIRQYQVNALTAQKAYNDALAKSGKGSIEAITAQAHLGTAQAALTKATEGTVPALTQQQKVLAAHSLILKQTKDAQGDFARTSDGLANQQRILSATFSDLRTKIGSALLPVVLIATKALNKLLSGAIGPIGDKATQLGDALSKNLTPALAHAGPKLTALFSGKGIGNGSSTLGKLRDSFTKLGHTLKGIDLSALADSFGKGASDTVSVFSVAIGFLADHTSLLAKVLPGLILAYVAFKAAQAANNVLALAHIPLQAAQIAANFALASSNRALATQLAVTNGVETSTLFTRARTTVATIASTVAGLAASAAAKAMAAGQWLLNAALNANPIGLIVLAIAALVAGLIIAYKHSSTFRSIVDALGKAIRERAIPVLKAMGGIIGDVIKFLVKIGSAVGGVIGDLGRFAAFLTSTVLHAVGDVLHAITGLPGSIKALGGKMLDAGKAIIGKFLDGLKHAGGAAAGIVGGIWNALKGLINGAIDSINNSLEFSIGIGFGKHISINAPDIPHLARGTSSFAGGFARVGEEGPENVLLPRGSRVFTARDSAAAGAGVYIASQTVVAHDYQDFVGQSRRTSQQAALGGRRNPR